MPAKISTRCRAPRCGQQVPFGRPRVVDEEHSPVAQEACRRLVAVPRDHRVCAAALRLHHPNIARVPSPAPTAISPVSSDAGTAAGLDGADALVTGVLALWPEGVQAVITAVIAANSARAPNRPTGLSVTRIHTRRRRVGSLGVVELSTPRRVGARTGAGDRGDQAGEFEGRTKVLALEVQIPVEPVVVVEPGK